MSQLSQSPMVYVVDDDPSVSQALTRLLRVAGLRMASFATAGDFLNQPGIEEPACLVLDMQLPDSSGLDLQKALADRGWTLPIVFITGHGTVPMAVEAMRAGAVHFLPKPCDNRELIAAIRQALDRDGQRVARREESQQVKDRLDSLTPREREVFALVATGMANKVIAARLGVSLQTVKLHRGHVMQKLELRSVAELVQLSERAGAGQPSPNQPGPSQPGAQSAT